MAKITYEDKEFLNKNENIADKNKVNDTDLNQIKEVVNENDDKIGNLSDLNTTDKSSLVNAINEVNIVGKYISLTKNENQNSNANVITKVSWEVEEVNTTDGILVKDGDNIKCNKGSHTICINAMLQLLPTNATISTASYIYIRKLINGEIKEFKTTNALMNPQITVFAQINEGESIFIDAYCNNNYRISNSSVWNSFQVILLD